MAVMERVNSAYELVAVHNSVAECLKLVFHVW